MRQSSIHVLQNPNELITPHFYIKLRLLSRQYVLFPFPVCSHPDNTEIGGRPHVVYLCAGVVISHPSDASAINGGAYPYSFFHPFFSLHFACPSFLWNLQRRIGLRGAPRWVDTASQIRAPRFVSDGATNRVKCVSLWI